MTVIFLLMFLCQNQQALEERQCVHIGLGVGHGYGQGAGQGQGCQMPGVGDHLKLLSEKLNLSQSQQARIQDILEDLLAQLEAIRRDGTLFSKDRLRKVPRLRAASVSKLRDPLDDDQKQKFDEMRQAQRERVGESGGDCSMIWIAVE
jgi:hypothetical protein